MSAGAGADASNTLTQVSKFAIDIAGDGTTMDTDGIGPPHHDRRPPLGLLHLASFGYTFVCVCQKYGLHRSIPKKQVDDIPQDIRWINFGTRFIGECKNLEDEKTA